VEFVFAALGHTPHSFLQAGMTTCECFTSDDDKINDDGKTGITREGTCMLDLIGVNNLMIN